MKNKVNQMVTSATPGTAATVLKEFRGLLTAKQTSVLTRKLGQSKKLAAVPLQVPKPRTQITNQLVVARSAGSSDPRDDQHYNALYASLGLPENLPMPRPFHKDPGGAERYVTALQGTPTYVGTIPAGKTGMICVIPQDYKYPCQMFTDKVGGDNYPTTVFDISRAAAELDNLVEAATYDKVGWTQDTAPFSAYTSAGAIKNAATGTVNLPNTAEQPPMIQVLGTRIDWSVDVPYQGSAVVYPFNPGLDSNRLGHGGQTHRFAGGFDSEHFGYDRGFQPQAKLPMTHTTTSQTPIQLAQLFAKPIVMTGGSASASMHGTVNSAGIPTWSFAGRLDLVDAPAGSGTSIGHCMRPRNNAIDLAQYGYVIVQNTSATETLTVSMSARCAFAICIRADDQGTTINQLVSLQRHNAREIEAFAERPRAMQVVPAVTATTKDTLIEKKTEAVVATHDVHHSVVTETHSDKSAQPALDHKPKPEESTWKKIAGAVWKAAEFVDPILDVAQVAYNIWTGQNVAKGTALDNPIVHKAARQLVGRPNAPRITERSSGQYAGGGAAVARNPIVEEP